MTPFIKKLAVEMKSAMATGYTLDEIGIVLEDAGYACGTGSYPAMCNEAFSALCDEVEAALPFVRADRQQIVAYQIAAAECRAADASERAYFSQWGR